MSRYPLWVVAVDGRHARFFVRLTQKSPLTTMPELNMDAPAAQHGRDQRPARVHDRMGHHRHGVAAKNSATDTEDRFVADVGRRIEQAARDKLAAGICIFAAPRALGGLRQQLSAVTDAICVAAFDKEVIHATSAELDERMRDASL